MKFRIVLTGACAGTLVLAGCGGGGDTGKAAAGSPEAVAAVRAATTTTVESGSSRTRTTMTMTSGDRTVTLTGEGLFDYRRRIGTVSLDVPKDSGLTGPLQEIVTPEALYMKNATPGVPADKWVRIDVKGLADGNLISGGSADPTTSFEILRGVNEDVNLVGTEKLGNDDVRRYKGTLDIQKAHDLTPEAQRAPLAAALKSFASTTIPFEVLLDAQGRLRKVQEEFNLASGGTGGKEKRTAKVVSSAELYDFGVAVQVQAPRPEELYVAEGSTPANPAAPAAPASPSAPAAPASPASPSRKP